MSEAVHRLFRDYTKSGKVDFSQASWPKPEKAAGLPLKEFKIAAIPLGQRMEALLKHLWSTRFVFLETLWEEYLEELVKELRHKDTSLFEPFVEREFMADIVREVITDRLASVDEIKDEVAARFAAGLTRRPWEEQWRQLRRLEIGLTDKDEQLPWFANLATYFEMRNCIIHRQGRRCCGKSTRILRTRDSTKLKSGLHTWTSTGISSSHVFCTSRNESRADTRPNRALEPSAGV